MLFRSTAVPTAWIRIPRQIQVERNSTETVSLTIETSEYTRPGEYEVRVSYPPEHYDDEEARLKDNSGPYTTLRITILEVLSEIIDTDLTYPKSLVLEGTPTATLRVSNEGEEELIPRGTAILANKKGEIIHEWKINESATAIQSEEIHDEFFKLPADTKLKPGTYNLTPDVTFGIRTSSSIQDVATFSFIPLKKVIALFVLAILLIIGLVYFFDRKEEE